MNYKNILIGGMGKSIALDNYPESAWQVIGDPQTTSDLKDIYKRVAWLSRGIKIRASVLSRVPFAIISKNGDDYDNSDTWNNKLGYMQNPRRLLYVIEESLCLMNRAYLIKELNTAKVVKNLKYTVPTTMKDIIDPVKGLTGFERNVNNQKIKLDVDRVIYFYEPSAFTEVGGGDDFSPAQAALQAAQVLYSLDAFANLYFKRGAIRATILSVAGNPPKEERDRIESWWNEMLMGLKNAFKAKVFNADAVKAEQIGDGLEGLRKGEIVKAEREDIATALGIPQSILFSNAANYATAMTDMRSFLENTIEPECLLIADTFNEQLLQPLQLRMEFRPEALDAFKEDEMQMASAYATFTGTGMKPSIAARLVGLEMPQNYDYDMLDEEERDYVTDSPLNQELMRWKRKAENSLQRGRTAAVKYESDIISSATHEHIKNELKNCTTLEDIRKVFRNEQPKKGNINDLIKTLETAVNTMRETDNG